MGGIKLYNTLTRKKETFKPVHKDRVGLYTCGPTVYNFVHIGNLRSYVFEDILRRTLEYSGYKVRHVMNITDIEDKIIRDSQKAGKTIYEFTGPYEKAFFEDIAKLNIERAWKYPLATGHIPGMIAMIKKLLKKGVAYETDGSVYFSISKFKQYGRLSGVKNRELKSGIRIDADEYEKNNARDFALWKARKPGEPSWKTPFGEGHPGWHIECSVMSVKYLGQPIDIHTGGVDNIFPHHENEIAQSEALTGKKFVNYWVHGEHLLVDNQKMSKSLGNFYTLRDIEAKGIDPLAFRYLILTAHYRSKLNFTWESLQASRLSLMSLRAVIETLSDMPINKSSKIGWDAVKTAQKEFTFAIENDLNTPMALGAMHTLINQWHRSPESFNPKTVLKLLGVFDKVLGLGLKNIKKEGVSAEAEELAKKREVCRQKKDWVRADELRKKIESLGYHVEDTPQGPVLKKN